MLRAQGRFEEAIPEYETVIAFNRNHVFAYPPLGQCKFFTGSVEEAIPLQQRHPPQSARSRYRSWYLFRIGVVHLLQSRTDEAIIWLEKARSANPANVRHAHALLASAYALKGADRTRCR